MSTATKTLLKWSAGIVLLFLAIEAVCPFQVSISGTQARRSYVLTNIENFAAACRAYQKEYGSYPSGNLPEVLSTLTGKNPRGIVFVEIPAKDRNPAGELVDSWKTPYHLVPASGDDPPQLISAGQDKVFGTNDDITLNGKSQ